MSEPLHLTRVPHLTDEQLDRLRAGIDADGAEHLATCVSCQKRFNVWDETHPQPQPALAQALAARRHAVLAQAPATSTRHWYYSAIAATLLAVGVGLYVFLPATQPPATVVAEKAQADNVPDLYADIDFYLWLTNKDREERGESNSS